MPEKNLFPLHIAIIMDGNGRWAKERGLARTAGHREGIKRIKEIVKAAKELGVKYLTLFAFSTENWNRPKREVNMLMRYLDNFLKREIDNLNKDNIRIIVIGREKPVPTYLINRIKSAQEITAGNNGLFLIIAFNYGARQEILDAVKKYSMAVINKEEDPREINEDTFSRFLYTKDIPDPDLLIRTSGELRISNFLLWQISYAEFYFTNKYWPDFNKEELEKAIFDYQRRERRFGRI